jgi:hypothetical protein
MIGGVFTEADLSAMLSANAGVWRVAKSVKRKEFIGFLISEMGLRAIEMKSERYGSTIRYVWGEYSPYAMALTLRPRSYLSHGTAVLLHGLNDQASKTIYVNQEQSKKPASGTLSQERLNLAFSRRQRTSSYVFSLEGRRVVLLSGKHTVQLGVVAHSGLLGERLPVTGIARTLIDIVVRPAYAGGIQQVLEAYRGAEELVDTAELVRTLRQLNYLYPYHQAVGFLLERAGYPEKEWVELKRLGTEFDFYLVHGMKSPQYDSGWRLFYPQGM